MEATPEGFLVCKEVPIARTGVQLYHATELPKPLNADGWDDAPDQIVKIERTPEEVFAKQTLESFNGKPVVNDHPDNEDRSVDNSNWRDLTVGIAIDVRRGTGDQENVLFADLVIFDPDMAALIVDGKREVSCGYDCDYEQMEPGRGVQKNIIGNHVAIVEQGRCGSLCSIQDSDSLCEAKKK
jgi:hypothetical protein